MGSKSLYRKTPPPPSFSRIGASLNLPPPADPLDTEQITLPCIGERRLAISSPSLFRLSALLDPAGGILYGDTGTSIELTARSEKNAQPSLSFFEEATQKARNSGPYVYFPRAGTWMLRSNIVTQAAATSALGTLLHGIPADIAAAHLAGLLTSTHLQGTHIPLASGELAPLFTVSQMAAAGISQWWGCIHVRIINRQPGVNISVAIGSTPASSTTGIPMGPGNMQERSWTSLAGRSISVRNTGVGDASIYWEASFI